MRIVRKVAAYVTLVSVYGLTWAVAVVGKAIPRRRWTPTGRIAVTGTFFNPNWYLSHITPLVRSGLKEVILVTDEPQQPIEGVRFVCPPRWLAKMISRGGAKAIWMLYAGIRYRPDLFMGYNLVAGGCTALALGAVLGRPTCYQMTGGYLVLSTVGVETYEPKPMSKWRRKIHAMIERLAISVIRKFDLVVVRGSKAKAFLSRYGIAENVAVITGSIKDMPASSGDRTIDLVFVGRLNPIKQVDQFIQIVGRVSHVIPSVKAVIVGDGPLMADMKASAEQCAVNDKIVFLGKREDVEDILVRSKVFVLPSKSEGMSIALAEAMTAGAVPVVADVGDLGDLVRSGHNGYLIAPNDINGYVATIVLLLRNRPQWDGLSQNAAKAAREYCHIDAVSQKWRRNIQNVIRQAVVPHVVPPMETTQDYSRRR